MRRSTRQPEGWLVLLSPRAWQILPPSDEAPALAPVEFQPDALGDQAAPIVQALQAAGWRRAPVVIGLSTAACLAATVEVPAAAMLRKRQAMRFHLESVIPWSAEEFVADYVPHKASACMIAVRTSPLQELLSELDHLDATVTAVTPEALLALETHLDRHDLPADHALVWRHGDGAELYLIRDGKLLVWQSIDHCSPGTLSTLCGAAALEAPSAMPWYSQGLSDGDRDALGRLGLSATELPPLDWVQAIRSSVARLATGAAESIINLRRDELVGAGTLEALARPLRRLQLAGLTAALACCAALWIVGDRYQQAAMDVQKQVTAVFERTFPQEPPPDRVVAALRRAQQILQGTRGPVKALPTGPSSDQVLQQLLAVLPTDLRYRVPEIRIEGASVSLAGEVRSNGDADRIAAALRTAGFGVDSPRTQRLSGEGFSVRLAAQVDGAGQGGERK